MSLHHAVLIKIDDSISRRLPRRSIPSPVLTHVEHRDHRGPNARETCTRKQRPKPGLVRRSVLLWEQIASRNAHGGAERLEQSRRNGLLDITATIARNIAHGQSHTGQNAGDGQERCAITYVVVMRGDEDEHEIAYRRNDGVDDHDA